MINYFTIFNFFTFPSRLLAVNESINQIPIVKQMKTFYDNFEMNSLVDETITEHEEIEQSNFIEMLLATPVMK